MDTVISLELLVEVAGMQRVIHPTLLRDEHEAVLVDCGFPGTLPLVQQAAAAAGVDLGTLTRVIITHHDYDHMGALAACKRAYPRLQVLASALDAPHISGTKQSLRLEHSLALLPSLPPEQQASELARQRRLRDVETVPVDVLVADGDVLPCCGGVEIVATPGHMPGHISVYARASRTLISGDALTMNGAELAGPNPQYTLDMPQAKRSIEKLLGYDIERVICYHGGVYTKNVRESLRKLL